MGDAEGGFSCGHKKERKKRLRNEKAFVWCVFSSVVFSLAVSRESPEDRNDHRRGPNLRLQLTARTQ